MGDLIPFRKRKKTWTKPEDYGRVLPTARWRGEPGRRGSPGRVRRFWNGARWWLGIIAIAAAWVVWRDAHLFAPPLLEGEPVRVSGDFVRCGPARLGGKDGLCVVDGDSLRIGSRDVRLLGIDAPELRGSCPAESALGERAATALLGWANAAPLELVPRIDRPTDKYGRELMTARRTVGGREQTAAGALLAAGLARPYSGEARKGWC